MPRLAASWWQLRCGWSYLDQLPKLQMPATVVAQSIILLIDNPPFPSTTPWINHRLCRYAGTFGISHQRPDVSICFEPSAKSDQV